jgi:hypothetical protein
MQEEHQRMNEWKATHGHHDLNFARSELVQKMNKKRNPARKEPNTRSEQ